MTVCHLSAVVIKSAEKTTTETDRQAQCEEGRAVKGDETVAKTWRLSGDTIYGYIQYTASQKNKTKWLLLCV